MSMDKEILKEIELLEGEVDFYLALLRLGPSLVSRIHKETGLHRTHIYDLLEKLKEKGLESANINWMRTHLIRSLHLNPQEQAQFL